MVQDPMTVWRTFWPKTQSSKKMMQYVVSYVKFSGESIFERINAKSRSLLCFFSWFWYIPEYFPDWNNCKFYRDDENSNWVHWEIPRWVGHRFPLLILTKLGISLLGWVFGSSKTEYCWKISTANPWWDLE